MHACCIQQLKQPSHLLDHGDNLYLRSSKYVGEGMSASMTGLALGFSVLVLGNIFLEEGVTEQLLTFNHSNFFV